MNRYEEKPTLHPIINILYVVLVGFLIWAVWDDSSGPLLVLILVSIVLLVIPLIFGKLVIRVDEQALHVVFGMIGWPAQHIPLDSIKTARAVDYRPIINFGGWGIRRGRLDGEMTSAYTSRGKRGVLFELKEERRICAITTSRFLVSSEQPEKLAATIGR